MLAYIINVFILYGTAQVAFSAGAWAKRLCHPRISNVVEATRTVAVTAIPYDALANHTPAPMLIWLRYSLIPLANSLPDLDILHRMFFWLA